MVGKTGGRRRSQTPQVFVGLKMPYENQLALDAAADALGECRSAFIRRALGEAVERYAAQIGRRTDPAAETIAA